MTTTISHAAKAALKTVALVAALSGLRGDGGLGPGCDFRAGRVPGHVPYRDVLNGGAPNRYGFRSGAAAAGRAAGDPAARGRHRHHRRSAAP